jgi:hypothetical protein
VRGKAEAPTVRNRLGDPVGGRAAPASADPSGAARAGTDPTAAAGDTAGPTG